MSETIETPPSGEKMIHTTEERVAKFRCLLDSPDDVALFTRGGCAIFAIMLHGEFGHEIRLIPGIEKDSTAHVFAIFKGDKNYAIDATGTQPANDCVCHYGLSWQPLTLKDLYAKFEPIGHTGLVGDPWFVIPSVVRARARIIKYRAYFDGTRKEQIP